MASSLLDSIKRKLEPTTPEDSLYAIVYQETCFDLGNIAMRNPSAARQMGGKKQITEAAFRTQRFFGRKPGKNVAAILGTRDSVPFWKYLDLKYIDQIKDNLEKYKAIIPRDFLSVIHNETDTLILSARPGTGYTDAFLSIGAFDTEQEALAVVQYLKTGLVRFLYTLYAPVDSDYSSVWRHIQLQDFSPVSDIIWTNPVSEINIQLYKKYGLNEAEIELIESRGREL